MYTLGVGLMSLTVFGLIAVGLAMEYNATLRNTIYAWRRLTIITQLVLFAVAMVALGIIGGQEAMAAATAAAEAAPLVQTHATAGLGLELVGIGIPTAGAAIGAGVAVGQIGAASLGVVAEKPEMFGRTLIFLGLGEGIAIYGLVMSILLLGKM